MQDPTPGDPVAGRRMRARHGLLELQLNLVSFREGGRYWLIAHRKVQIRIHWRGRFFKVGLTSMRSQMKLPRRMWFISLQCW